MLLTACFWMSFIIVILLKFLIKEILYIELDLLSLWLLTIGLTTNIYGYFLHRKNWG